jgi:hypothetical protein
MQMSWENENANRSFPFQKETTDVPGAASGSIQQLPDSAVVDAGFIVGLEAGFNSAVNLIWLNAVRRSGSTFWFDFASDAPGLYGKILTFTRTLTDPQGTVEFQTVDEAGFSMSMTSTDLSVCAGEPLWEGYLVSGDLTDLAGVLPDGQQLLRSGSGAELELALVQNLAHTYVSAINLANANRTRATAPLVCPPLIWSYPIAEDEVYVTARCLRGDIRFVRGYNLDVAQTDYNNTITLAPSPGGGLGQPCNTEPTLFDGEIPPDGSTLLEGGPRCSDLLRTINGLGGANAMFVSGVGAQIIPLPATNTIIIDVNMHGLQVCYSEGLSEMSETSVSETWIPD